MQAGSRQLHTHHEGALTAHCAHLLNEPLCVDANPAQVPQGFCCLQRGSGRAAGQRGQSTRLCALSSKAAAASPGLARCCACAAPQRAARWLQSPWTCPTRCAAGGAGGRGLTGSDVHCVLCALVSPGLRRRQPGTRLVPAARRHARTRRTHQQLRDPGCLVRLQPRRRLGGQRLGAHKLGRVRAPHRQCIDFVAHQVAAAPRAPPHQLHQRAACVPGSAGGWGTRGGMERGDGRVPLVAGSG